jgi:salicylate hydroxylase
LTSTHFLNRSRHWETNEVVSVDKHHGSVEDRHRTSRFYRPHLQQALLSHVDPARVHLRKTFLAVENNPETGALAVSFADGSVVESDLLLGADGIKSAVRLHFVPTSAAQWTGWVAFRSVFDAKLVEHIPGVLDEASHWWGPDRAFFASRLGKGLFTIVGGNHSDPNAPNAPYKDAVWNADEGVDAVKELYADWHSVVKQMLEATPHVRHYPNTFASGLESWVHGDGRVTFAGDAAHAHGGALAAGGSLALDDAYAFALAVLHVYPPGPQKPSKESITKALRLYEGTRKAHTDRVLSTVHANNKKAIERVGLLETDQQLRKRMMGRADPFWIHEHDVEATFAHVLAQEASEPQARL